MAETTEAACLLQTGRLYLERLGLRDIGGPHFPPPPPPLAGFKSGAFSLYYDDAPIYHFDLEGRWQRAFVDGLHYLKGLDTRVQAIDRPREGANMVLRRRTSPFAEAADLDAQRIRQAAIRSTLPALMVRSPVASPSCPTASARSRAGRPPPYLSLNAHRLLGFGRLVPAARPIWASTVRSPSSPPRFLTPSSYRRPSATNAPRSAWPRLPISYARSPAEFSVHSEAVRSLWGRRREQAQAVYLGGSDVWRRPAGEIASFLEIAGADVRPRIDRFPRRLLTSR